MSLEDFMAWFRVIVLLMGLGMMVVGVYETVTREPPGQKRMDRSTSGAVLAILVVMLLLISMGK